MRLIGATLETPWKPLSMIVDLEGVDGTTVVAAAFEPMKHLVGKGGFTPGNISSDPSLGGLSAVVADYIDGKTNAFDALVVRQPGGEFMQACWTALRKVRSGTVVSYAQLAAAAGRPAAIRAAGTACATNLIAPIIPCHRVVRTGGDLGNYGFGVPLKRTLLLHEGVDLP
jgi:methylated-DNA-[protein]-cysteine S-methyltransferase